MVPPVSVWRSRLDRFRSIGGTFKFAPSVSVWLLSLDRFRSTERDIMIFVQRLQFWYYGLDLGRCNFVLGYQTGAFILNAHTPVPEDTRRENHR